MAHSGPRYPLHFRRDMTLNAGTRFGWAKDYSCNMDDAFGQPLINPAQPNPWLTDGGVVTSPYRITYTGVPYVTGVGTWDWLLEATNPGESPAGLHATLRLRLNAVDWHIRICQSSPLVDYRFLGAFGWNIIFNHPPPGISTPSQFMQASAVNW